MSEVNLDVNKFDAVIFDMDGVLVDVSQSYRLAIKKTAEFFLGKIIDFAQIELLKLTGGYNDDYDCTEAILRNHGKYVPRGVIIKKFQEYYIGRAYTGLIDNEKWLLEKKILSILERKYKLGIFTGRPKNEANYALKTATTSRFFKAVITIDDVVNKKPSPEGLNMAIERLKAKSPVYVGDSIDDLHSAISSNIDFIGVISPGSDRNKSRAVLKDNGAKVVLENVNGILKFIG